jgi:hypothetical protein
MKKTFKITKREKQIIDFKLYVAHSLFGVPRRKLELVKIYMEGKTI